MAAWIAPALQYGIPAATALLGSVLGMKSAQKSREQQAQLQGAQQIAQGQQQAAAQMQSGTQNALGQILGGYKSALR